MRAFLIAVTLLGGCAWIFQTPNHSSRGAVPDCSTGNGWAAVDGVFAILNLAGAAIVIGDESAEDVGATVVGGIVGAAIHLASAATGRGWSSECRAAWADWGRTVDGATDAQAEAKRFERAHRAELAAPIVPKPVAAAPRGFFCSSNTTTSFCVRDKAECERTRDVSIAALPDLTACTLVETAWCFGERCATTEATCDEQSQRAGGLACVESK